MNKYLPESNTRCTEAHTYLPCRFCLQKDTTCLKEGQKAGSEDSEKKMIF